VEGDPGTAVKVHSPCQMLYIAVAVVIDTTVHGEIRTGMLSRGSHMC